VTDLAARLRAVVEERLAVARAAGEPFGSRWSIRMTAGALGPDVGEHIALNGPADVILACERDLAALGDHGPNPAGPGMWRCDACRLREWPCGEIRRMATRYRVEVQ